MGEKKKVYFLAREVRVKFLEENICCEFAEVNTYLALLGSLPVGRAGLGPDLLRGGRPLQARHRHRHRRDSTSRPW